MRAILLSLALVCSPLAASAAEPEFLARLRGLGPQPLRTADNLGAPAASPNARLEVTADGALRLSWRDGGGAERHFRFHPAEDPVAADMVVVGEMASDCKGGGTAERYEVSCWMPSDRDAASVRPPTVVYRFELGLYGARALRTGARGVERLVFSPPTARRRPPPGVAEGAPAALADALGQLAAHEKSGMGGGSSGGGDWYASDLWLVEAKGLDFVLTRTVWPDRGGRSHLVPARWAFDYRGPLRGESGAMTWLMTKDGREEFWCVGRPRRSVVEVACRPGRAPWRPDQKTRPAFVFAPFPQWVIRVEEGPHSLFSSVGTSRLEPAPWP
jgi:hypothetical protein